MAVDLKMIVAVEHCLDAVAIHGSDKVRLERLRNLDRYGFGFEWDWREA
jgi:hypothetical protein